MAYKRSRRIIEIDRGHPATPELPLDGVLVGQGGLEAIQLVGHGHKKLVSVMRRGESGSRQVVMKLPPPPEQGPDYLPPFLEGGVRFGPSIRLWDVGDGILWGTDLGAFDVPHLVVVDLQR